MFKWILLILSASAKSCKRKIWTKTGQKTIRFHEINVALTVNQINSNWYKFDYLQTNAICIIILFSLLGLQFLFAIYSQPRLPCNL